MRIKRWLLSWVGLGALALVLFVGRPPLPFGQVVSGVSFHAALAAQARVTEAWLDMDGVVGTAVGLGTSGEPVLTVYLTKLGAATLPAAVAGVPVRREVTGPFTSLADSAPDRRAGFPRPVPIGVSAGHPRVTAGTIGARVSDGSRVFALSNNHVLAANNRGRPGDNLLQPGIADGGRDPDDSLGTLHDFEPIEFCGDLGCPMNRMDAALALTTTGELGNATPEDGYGRPRSTPMEAALGMKVQKYGRTTGLTRGRVTGLNATLDVNYRTGTARFTGQIVISGDGFSTGGDSGSLVVTRGVLAADRRPVGLLFAGSATSTLVNPIEPVLDRFGVNIDGG